MLALAQFLINSMDILVWLYTSIADKYIACIENYTRKTMHISFLNRFTLSN